VQVVQARRIGLGQRARQEIGLLLVVAFQHHAVARRGDGFEKGTMSSVGTTLPVAICAPGPGGAASRCGACPTVVPVSGSA
jgi:hypothetical protein